mmetsp:Transcript_62343/g.201013  ORF Transcript_62343/g.201013 Transcript_62343/m.201013 type:complete len:388 (+) Transcript_62343:645-1808(+)
MGFSELPRGVAARPACARTGSLPRARAAPAEAGRRMPRALVQGHGQRHVGRALLLRGGLPGLAAEVAQERQLAALQGEVRPALVALEVVLAALRQAGAPGADARGHGARQPHARAHRRRPGEAAGALPKEVGDEHGRVRDVDGVLHDLRRPGVELVPHVALHDQGAALREARRHEVPGERQDVLGPQLQPPPHVHLAVDGRAEGRDLHAAVVARRPHGPFQRRQHALVVGQPAEPEARQTCIHDHDVLAEDGKVGHVAGAIKEGDIRAEHVDRVADLQPPLARLRRPLQRLRGAPGRPAGLRGGRLAPQAPACERPRRGEGGRGHQQCKERRKRGARQQPVSLQRQSSSGHGAGPAPRRRAGHPRAGRGLGAGSQSAPSAGHSKPSP